MNHIDGVTIFSTKDKINKKLHLFFEFFKYENNKEINLFNERISISLKPSKNEIDSIFNIINKNISNSQPLIKIVSNSAIESILNCRDFNYEISNISKRENNNGCLFFLYQYKDNFLKEFTRMHNLNLNINLVATYENSKLRKKQLYYKAKLFLSREDMINNNKCIGILNKALMFGHTDAQFIIYHQIVDFVNSIDIKFSNLYFNHKHNANKSPNIMKKIINTKNLKNINKVSFIEDKIKNSAFTQREINNIRNMLDDNLDHKANNNFFNVVYTDGSCCDDKFSAAFIIDSKNNNNITNSFSGTYKESVISKGSNYAELVALYSALNSVVQNNILDKPLSIVLDSDYVALNLRWIKEKKYHLISKSLKKSQLFRKIYQIITHYNIDYFITCLKSHSTNTQEIYLMNNQVDQMANLKLKNIN